MREIKFRYVWKHKETGKLGPFLYFDIETLECGIIHTKDSFDLISRDQFTGMKDKNGKEIYGKDHFGEPAYPVEFLDGAFWHEGELLRDCLHLEVIGNIHE